MSHLLHTDSSIRPIEQSRSRKLSNRYAEAWRDANPGGTVTYRDLAAEPIPHMDATSFHANFLAPEERLTRAGHREGGHRRARQRGAGRRHDCAGHGLYNFGVPSTVKAWFDRLVVPGVTLGEHGGTLGDKKLVLFDLGHAEDLSYEAAEGDRVVLQWTSRARTREGLPYENGCVGISTVRDGKIHAVREYMDTLYVARAFSPERAPA